MSDLAPRHATLKDATLPARRVAMLSVSVALGLTAIKLVGWWLSGSVGLLASLADSGLDVVAASSTLAAIGYASTPPDAEHRFGHGKAEAFASLLQAALIFTSAALIAREAISRLIDPRPLQTQWLALAILVLSTVLALAVAAAQGRVLKDSRSVAVESDRLHYLADAGSNVAAFVGVVLAGLLHSPRADALAGLAVALALAWGGVHALRNAADNLMDHELDDTERDAIVALAIEDPAIQSVHDLRTRAAGPIVHIQMHVDMDPRLTLEEAHRILIRAEHRILARFPSADLLIHPDPYGRAEAHSGVFAEASANLAAHDRMTDAPATAREGA
ncbi:cation diffusion facilitator family transporter [Caulobacter sp. S45]|uniref:cation diffusion facilitator family transporter n=1 Tax=Caulobacter sp. S45 TaxID=1641861 RepID=UPI00131A7BBF|nr:cation diffusion facilitator family transporter [Caulobacter sp. S45]